MRLSESESRIITHAVTAKDPDAVVYLFGSRADDAAKGGGIDLPVLSGKISLMDKLDILAEVHGHLGEQKIDFVVYPGLSRPIGGRGGGAFVNANKLALLEEELHNPKKAAD